MGLSTAPVAASSLNTDVAVEMPSVIALYCYDRVHVNVGTDEFLNATGRNGLGARGTLNRTARGRAGRWNVRAPRNRFNRRRFTLREVVNLDLTGVCALRALTGSGGVRVRVDALDTSLKTPTGASIDVQRIRVRDGENGGGFRRRYDLPASDLGLATVRDIDLRLRLDLSNATEAGTYSSDTDGTFVVTVIARP